MTRDGGAGGGGGALALHHFKPKKKLGNFADCFKG